MELRSAITVVMATRLALPVSTTQCIAGATVGVGLCWGIGERLTGGWWPGFTGDGLLRCLLRAF